MTFRQILAGLGILATLGLSAPAASEPIRVHPAWKQDAPSQLAMFAAKATGGRVVAVGELGAVLLSDDSGKSFRQATEVPVQASLLDVFFVSEKKGWAVGHWGTILATEDGGEHWQIQHSDPAIDRPFFSVWFRDAEEGWAVGLWSLVYKTVDGGRSWQKVTLPPPPGERDSDTNLMKIFGDAHGNPIIAAERGRVIRSLDGGQTWEYLSTGYGGTFWTGLTLKDGSLIVAGMLGNIYRSTDDGKTWARMQSGTGNSLTDIIQEPGGRLLVVGLGGTVLTSDNGGFAFSPDQAAQPVNYTAIVDANAENKLVFFSKEGVVKVQ